MQQTSCLRFFPQSPDSLLTDQKSKLKTLALLSFFIDSIILSIELFYIQRKLIAFDSHVGETLCHIRACQLSLFASERNDDVESDYQNYLEIRQRVQSISHLFQNAINDKNGKYNALLDRPERFQEFLQKHDLIFSISDDLLYLVQNQILAEYNEKNEYGISLRINYERLCTRLQAGKTISRKLARHLQRELSRSSCAFIKNLSGDSEQTVLLNLLQLTDNHKRMVLPCYEVTKIILENLIILGKPIGIIVYRLAKMISDKICLLFYPETNHMNFELLDYHDEIKTDVPLFFVSGVVEYSTDVPEPINEYITRFLKVGVKKIILSNMAAHPQYSAKEFSDLCKNPYKPILENDHKFMAETLYHTLPDFSSLPNYLTLKERAINLNNELISLQGCAERLGCAQTNASLFFIKHIFCDQMRNQFEKWSANIPTRELHLNLKLEERITLRSEAYNE